ncbi:hypothetical protein KC19_VG108300 [Ceratodon purpureus]|uniref:Uncharacterized protein n=1 Tax=Ceratodon purpureus TaxID=3225 RepID=A0A8T0HP70_CERPU|nr:hypothetical protein KC19_VG108300 [Ceratodon purpureus]
MWAWWQRSNNVEGEVSLADAEGFTTPLESPKYEEFPEELTFGLRSNYDNTTLTPRQAALPSPSDYTVVPVTSRTPDFCGSRMQQQDSPSALLGREIERAVQLGDVSSPSTQFE